MSVQPWLRRGVLALGATCLLGFEPVPVRFEVRNHSAVSIKARLDADDPWVDIAPKKTVAVATFGHGGFCSPPNRWLPDTFTGLEIQRGDGDVTRIDRTSFESNAEWSRGPRWTLTLE